MQRWGYGTNNLYKSCHLYLEEAPWWAFWLRDTAWWICDKLPDWRIPLIGRLKVQDEGETHTWADWYENGIHSLFHAFICDPVFHWAERRITYTTIQIDWEHCKQLFYLKDKARWDEMESDPEFGKFTRPEELDPDELAIYRKAMGDKEPVPS